MDSSIALSKKTLAQVDNYKEVTERLLECRFSKEKDGYVEFSDIELDKAFGLHIPFIYCSEIASVVCDGNIHYKVLLKDYKPIITDRKSLVNSIRWERLLRKTLDIWRDE